MYWPSAPADGEYIFKAIDGDVLEPDQYLSRLSDWRDCSLWPTSSRQSEVIARSVTQQQDPLGKEGVVGAFCRAYSIEDAMSAFLPGIYEPSAMSGRYDYIPADSSAGMVLYEGKWAYSHHATDPACGKLLNAFDLVRIHKFGEMDDKKSRSAMCDFAVKDDAVKVQLAEERKTQAATDFEVDGNWESALALEKSGKVKDSLDNLVLIIDNDPNLACIAYNELRSNIDFTAMPAWKPIKDPTWTDNDTSQLRCYI